MKHEMRAKNDSGISMKCRNRAALLAATLIFASMYWPSASAQEPTEPERPLSGTGTWTPLPFTKLEEDACKQKFVCGPAEAIIVLEGEELVFSGDQDVTGTCVVRGSNPCRKCSVQKPASECSWQINQLPEPSGG